MRGPCPRAARPHVPTLAGPLLPTPSPMGCRKFVGRRSQRPTQPSPFRGTSGVPSDFASRGARAKPVTQARAQVRSMGVNSSARADRGRRMAMPTMRVPARMAIPPRSMSSKPVRCSLSALRSSMPGARGAARGIDVVTAASRGLELRVEEGPEGASPEPGRLRSYNRLPSPAIGVRLRGQRTCAIELGFCWRWWSSRAS